MAKRPQMPLNVNGNNQEKIDDAGEYIAGSRKELAQFENRDLSDPNNRKLPLTKLFPLKELDRIYASTHARILEDTKDEATAEKTATQVTAIATVLREQLGTRPRQEYKVNRWFENLVKAQLFIGLMSRSDPTFIDEMLTKMVDDANKGADKMYLLSKLDREDWSLVGDTDTYRTYRNEEGYQLVLSTEIGGNRFRIPVHDLEDTQYRQAIDKSLPTVKEYISNAREAVAERTDTLKVYDFNLYTRYNAKEGQKPYFITPKENKNIVLMEFDTYQERNAFYYNNRAELNQAWETYKETHNVHKGFMRRDVNRERVSEDYRQGRDITSTELIETFGIRGVQFGKWANQAERQTMLNNSYDSLMDLSKVLGIPPKAIGLNDTLGLGLGARGRGGANAHYERDYTVINLTKTRGAGSLAHEWLHAVDNYLSQDKDTYLSNGGSASIDDSLRGSMANLMIAIRQSNYAERSSNADLMRDDGYFSSNVEVIARAFEAYIIEKLARSGYANDFLSNIVPEEDWPLDPSVYVYPTKDEIRELEPYFDALLENWKTVDKSIEIDPAREGYGFTQDAPDVAVEPQAPVVDQVIDTPEVEAPIPEPQPIDPPRPIDAPLTDYQRDLVLFQEQANIHGFELSADGRTISLTAPIANNETLEYIRFSRMYNPANGMGMTDFYMNEISRDGKSTLIENQLISEFDIMADEFNRRYNLYNGLTKGQDIPPVKAEPTQDQALSQFDIDLSTARAFIDGFNEQNPDYPLNLEMTDNDNTYFYVTNDMQVGDKTEKIMLYAYYGDEGNLSPTFEVTNTANTASPIISSRTDMGNAIGDLVGEVSQNVERRLALIQDAPVLTAQETDTRMAEKFVDNINNDYPEAEFSLQTTNYEDHDKLAIEGRIVTPTHSHAVEVKSYYYNGTDEHSKGEAVGENSNLRVEVMVNDGTKPSFFRYADYQEALNSLNERVAEMVKPQDLSINDLEDINPDIVAGLGYPNELYAQTQLGQDEATFRAYANSFMENNPDQIINVEIEGVTYESGGQQNTLKMTHTAIVEGKEIQTTAKATYVGNGELMYGFNVSSAEKGEISFGDYHADAVKALNGFDEKLQGVMQQKALEVTPPNSPIAPDIANDDPSSQYEKDLAYAQSFVDNFNELHPNDQVRLSTDDKHPNISIRVDNRARITGVEERVAMFVSYDANGSARSDYQTTNSNMQFDRNNLDNVTNRDADIATALRNFSEQVIENSQVKDFGAESPELAEDLAIINEAVDGLKTRYPNADISVEVEKDDMSEQEILVTYNGVYENKPYLLEVTGKYEHGRSIDATALWVNGNPAERGSVTSIMQNFSEQVASIEGRSITDPDPAGTVAEREREPEVPQEPERSQAERDLEVLTKFVDNYKAEHPNMHPSEMMLVANYAENPDGSKSVDIKGMSLNSNLSGLGNNLYLINANMTYNDKGELDSNYNLRVFNVSKGEVEVNTEFNSLDSALDRFNYQLYIATTPPVAEYEFVTDERALATFAQKQGKTDDLVKIETNSHVNEISGMADSMTIKATYEVNGQTQTLEATNGYDGNGNRTGQWQLTLTNEATKQSAVLATGEKASDIVPTFAREHYQLNKGAEQWKNTPDTARTEVLAKSLADSLNLPETTRQTIANATKGKDLSPRDFAQIMVDTLKYEIASINVERFDRVGQWAKGTEPPPRNLNYDKVGELIEQTNHYIEKFSELTGDDRFAENRLGAEFTNPSKIQALEAHIEQYIIDLKHNPAYQDIEVVKEEGQPLKVVVAQTPINLSVKNEYSIQATNVDGKSFSHEYVGNALDSFKNAVNKAHEIQAIDRDTTIAPSIENAIIKLDDFSQAFNTAVSDVSYTHEKTNLPHVDIVAFKIDSYPVLNEYNALVEVDLNIEGRFSKNGKDLGDWKIVVTDAENNRQTYKTKDLDTALKTLVDKFNDLSDQPFEVPSRPEPTYDMSQHSMVKDVQAKVVDSLTQAGYPQAIIDKYADRTIAEANQTKNFDRFDEKMGYLVTNSIKKHEIVGFEGAKRDDSVAKYKALVTNYALAIDNATLYDVQYNADKGKQPRPAPMIENNPVRARQEDKTMPTLRPIKVPENASEKALANMDLLTAMHGASKGGNDKAHLYALDPRDQLKIELQSRDFVTRMQNRAVDGQVLSEKDLKDYKSNVATINTIEKYRAENPAPVKFNNITGDKPIMVVNDMDSAVVLNQSFNSRIDVVAGSSFGIDNTVAQIREAYPNTRIYLGSDRDTIEHNQALSQSVTDCHVLVPNGSNTWADLYSEHGKNGIVDQMKVQVTSINNEHGKWSLTQAVEANRSDPTPSVRVNQKGIDPNDPNTGR